MKISLVITTYNWKEALLTTLNSVDRQSTPPDEIIIGDDGSRPDTRDVIQAFAKNSNIPVNHVWQEDEGFQLARIRNRSIAAAKHEYIVCIDGDQVLHPKFIADHKKLAAQGHCFFPRRVYMNATLSEKYLAGRTSKPKWYAGGITPWSRALRIKPMLYTNEAAFKKRLKGSNMSFWRDDVIKVNGFDEAFNGWGSEDLEFAIRMMNSGVAPTVAKHTAVLFHIDHEDASRDQSAENAAMFEKAKTEKRQRCDIGISQYL